MGKSFYLSGFRDGDPRGGRDLYVDLELEVRAQGERIENMEALPMHTKPIMEPEYYTDSNGDLVRNPRYGQQATDRLGRPRSRPVREAGALGFASEDFHYGGNRIVTLKEEIEVKGGRATGRTHHYFQQIDDQGRSLGTFVRTYERDGEKRMRSSGRAKKYFSF